MNLLKVLGIISFFIILSVTVFYDSRKRGYNPYFWTVLILTVPFGGVFFYLLFRQIKSKKEGNIKNTKKICSLCGGNIQDDNCSICGGFYDEQNLNEYEKIRNRFLRITSVFLILTMFLFSVIYITPLRTLEYMDLVNAAEKILGKSFTFSESEKAIKHKFSLWTGTREKNISVAGGKYIEIHYELRSESGYLYSVLLKGDEIVFVFGNNSRGKAVIETPDKDILTLKISGEEASGKYSFRWEVKDDLQ